MYRIYKLIFHTYSPDDDVTIVSVKMPSADLQDMARRLQLPPTFYNYLTAPSCPGCIGCDPDDVDMNTITRERAVASSKPTSGQDGKIKTLSLGPGKNVIF